MTGRGEILGRSIFDVFPDNPADPTATGVRRLRESFGRVLDRRAPDAMAVQKYDIPRPASQGEGFEERFWSPVNSPVLGPDGGVAYIIHRVEDVTDFVRLQEGWRERDRLTEELRVRAERMESEVFLRARDLDDANRRLRAAHEELAAIHESDRRRADESLRVSRERLELVLGSVELGLFYCDLPFAGLVWNDRCKEHFGLPPDAEVTIDLFYERIHPDDRERTREAIEGSIAGRVAFDTDYRTVAPDGRERWIRAIGRGFYAAGRDPDPVRRRDGGRDRAAACRGGVADGEGGGGGGEQGEGRLPLGPEPRACGPR